MKFCLTSITFVLVLLICACGDSSSDDKGDINECFTLLQTAESFENADNDLPCGLRFGMNEYEMNAHLESLTKKPQSRVTKVGNFYHYMYEVNNHQYECMILGHADNKTSPINRFSFIFNNSEVFFRGDKDALYNDFKKEYKDLVFAYCQVGDGERLKHKVYCWGFQNLALILSDAIAFSLTFYNAPLSKPSQTLDFMERFTKKVGIELKEKDAIKKRGGKIANSPFDGSVYQVKKYLKSTLKDPDSYESISWGTVQKNNDGYSVYHKYRAKNSFGGYVVEEHVFNISEDGIITISQ